MEIDRITQPLRLAKGSHQPGSGKGCAMNAISYINGDAMITDFPECSARPLAALVQTCNDLLARPDGFLSPEDSLLALDLGWQTVGTADVPNRVIHAWIAEILDNPNWGVARYAKLTAVKAIIDIAELHRRIASGDMPPTAVWDAADRAAREAARALSGTANIAGRSALQAAYQSTAVVDTYHQVAVDTVTDYALRAHALATGGTVESRVIEFTRSAIRSWRELAGLDDACRMDSGAVDNAVGLIGVSAEGQSRDQ